MAKEEGFDFDDDQANQLIECSGNDIRQVINSLQMWNQQKTAAAPDSAFMTRMRKDEKVMINNFDAGHRLLNSGEGDLNGNYPTFRDKLDLFFVDYDWVPLLVQEGYLNSMQNRGKDLNVQDIEDMANASEFISMGDSINTQLRRNQDWSLLPNLGMCAAIAPALILQGKAYYPRFPEWLGENSS